jgi:hypothetical protein
MDNRLRTLIDANVLYSNALRNVFVTLGTQYVIVVKWTDEIEAEWVRNLTKNHLKEVLDLGDITEQTIDRVRCNPFLRIRYALI